jgi:hypothetical protein
LAEVPGKIFFQGWRAGGRGGVKVESASGQVKFWMRGGSIQKYEYTVRGTLDSEGIKKEVERNTTVEFVQEDVTKIVLPEKAREKLGIKN